MRPLTEFIDDVSTWYLRRSRDRFKTEGSDRQNAIFVTRFVIENIARLMAPVTPFIAEDLFLKVRFSTPENGNESSQSVHLMAWPLAISMPQKGFEDKIISEMSMVQSLVEQGLALRSNAKVKVRQPLSKFTYPIDDSEAIVLSDEMEEIIKDELNVKEVCRGSELSLDTEITLELKQEGVVRDLMRAIQEERKNKDLNPKDNINLMIATPKSGSDSEIVLRNYEDMIKNGVNAANISYVTPEFILELASDVTVPFLDESVSFAFEISTEIEAPAELIK